MFNLFSSRPKAYEDLNGSEFKEKSILTRGVLVDVRTASEVREGTIKGAKHIDFMSPNFKNEFSRLDKGKTYFLFCRSGSRSGQACNMLSKEGYQVYNLKRGIADWPH